MNLEQLVAKCRACDSVFAFGARLAHGAAPPRRRPDLPRGIRVEAGEPPLPDQPTYRVAPVRDRGPLVISRRWFGWHHALGATLGGSLLLFFFLILIRGPRGSLLGTMLPSIAVLSAVTYRNCAGLVNRTVLRLADGVLSVAHGPLPWLGGDMKIPTAQIRQLYLRRRFRWWAKQRGTYTWDVSAETEDEAEVTLVRGILEREQAEYIEWAIEEHLGIADDPARNVEAA